MKLNTANNRVCTPFGDFQIDVENLFDHLLGDRPAAGVVAWSPAANILESDSAYTVELELPGVSPDQVTVEMQDSTLEISGNKQVASTDEPESEPQDINKVKYLKTERRSGSFRRKFKFATLVDSDRIEARFENGLLLIDLPKSEKVLPRKIEIKVGE